MIDITPEFPSEHAAAIEDLYDRTFGPGHFAKTAERVREYGRSLPTISRVAVSDGAVIGAVRAWPVRVGPVDLALFVGPVAIDPAFRGQRLGLTVTDHVLDAAKEANWSAAILIGDPTYFEGAGFRASEPGRLVFPGPQDARRVLIRDLAGHADDLRGHVSAA
ncbi:MAG: N-acetyltransferase [Pseudomonadota bacterium]